MQISTAGGRMAKKAASTACIECECQKYRKNRGTIRALNRISSDLNAWQLERFSGQRLTGALPDPVNEAHIACKDCKHFGSSHIRNPAEALADYRRRIAIAEAEERRRNMEERARREAEWARLPRWRKALRSWSWRNPLIKLGPIVFFNWSLVVSAPVAVLVYKWLVSWHEAGGPPTWFKAIPAGCILASSSPLVLSVIRFIVDKALIIFGCIVLAGILFLVGLIQHWW